MPATRTLKRAFVAGAAIALLAMLALAFVAPPLIPSSAYTVRYAVYDIAKHDARVYKPFLISKRYYVHLSSTGRTEVSWFGVDFERGLAFAPSNPYFCPLGFYFLHRDQSVGVDLRDKKVGDWTVDFTDRGVAFSGEGLSVSFQR